MGRPTLRLEFGSRQKIAYAPIAICPSIKIMKLIVLLVFLNATAVRAQTAIVDVSLSPAGSFKIKSSDVRGYATESKGNVEASNIKVGLNKIQTGITLRDAHAKKRLDVEKYPDAELLSARGTGGKGEAQIKIKNISRKVFGTYKIEASHLVATFPIKLSDFQINDVQYMGVGVEDSVQVNVTVPIKKK
jgi:hypothetical protein